MPKRRDIDERDIDRLLAALTDRQIADLYGMTEIEVYRLRRSRQPTPKSEQKNGDQSKP